MRWRALVLVITWVCGVAAVSAAKRHTPVPLPTYRITLMPPTFYIVPAGTRKAQCNGPTCHASIYFIESPKTGKPMPIDCDVDGGEDPSETSDERQLALISDISVHDGRGVSHFTTCPDAEYFTGRNRQRRDVRSRDDE